jgi:hypothetical protein
MKSCPKCHKSGPGTRTSHKLLDLAGQAVKGSTRLSPPRPSMAAVLERFSNGVEWYIGNWLGL